MPATQTAPIGPSYITITVVDSEAEARNAFVQPGMSAWYLNRHEDVLYVKTGNTYPNPAGFRIFVSRAANIQIWNGCCENVTIRNTSDQPIQVQNANIVITRPDLTVTQ